MKTSRKTRQGQSVPVEKKREPMVVEMVFPDPVEEPTAPSAAQPTPPVDPSGSRRDPVRLVFRF
jgi:hypothetical protein